MRWRDYTDGQERVTIRIEHRLTRDEMAQALLAEIGGLLEYCRSDEHAGEADHLIVRVWDHVNHTSTEVHDLSAADIEERVRDQLWRNRDKIDFWVDDYSEHGLFDEPKQAECWDWARAQVNKL